MSNAKTSEVKAVFREALNLDGIDIDWSTLEYRSIREWDSLAHMVLVAALEERFDIMLDVDDVVGLSSFTTFIAMLGKYGVTVENDA